ncbi:MAG: two-component system sensor histidine kinase NtrB [bacterium]
MIWYTYQLESQFNLIEQDMTKLLIIDNLVTALLNQKGLLSYYVMDGNAEWLLELEEYDQSVRGYLEQVKGYSPTESDKKIIKKIKFEYEEYIKDKDQVIEYYKKGDIKINIKVIQHIRNHFLIILKICEEYKNSFLQNITQSRTIRHNQALRLRIISVSAMLLATLLSVILAIILIVQILRPVRRLALEIDQPKYFEKTEDEVVMLKYRVRNLIKDMGKFAIVGRLAAEAAHSIRNPLTAVKMRLFSMKSMPLSSSQQEDLDVISGEIRHINEVITNFLEFVRPPALKKQEESISDVVDASIRLLKHRLESYKVEIKVRRRSRFPKILLDPDQLREVFVNLIINACEAMKKGGTIIIEEEAQLDGNKGEVLVIRLIDDGPGIPASLQEKIFQPFFTSKEEGTGLGLTIAERIISDHGGWLGLESSEGKGATFVISLPLHKE